jgi:putative hemolysin
MFSVEQILRNEHPKLFEYPKLISKTSVSLLQLLLHEQHINNFLNDYPQRGVDFVNNVLEHLDISYKIDNKEMLNIPAIGKCIVVANHPLGALDALTLIQMLTAVRQEKKIKIVANVLLSQVKQLEGIIIPVDNISGKLTRESLQAIDSALQNEELVIFFPAGEVSRASINGVTDGKWKQGFLKIAKRTQSPILPIYINARNSLTFYTASMIFKPLGAILLADEIFKAKKSVLEFKIGELIAPQTLTTMNLSLSQHTKLFRKHLYKIAKGKKGIYKTEQCIAHPQSRQIIKKELATAELLGYTSDNKTIYLVEYEKAPALINEIGRLREYTFRMVGEGTGHYKDLDKYDEYYQHLVLWDDQELEVVGAYRIGECDWILSTYGKEGLYLNELCSMEDGHDQYLMEAIELGRSFVQPRYWGSRALDYLWQGIGAYLKHNPQIRYLMGPVTISGSYPTHAKDALVYFYNHYFAPKEQTLFARSPYRLSNITKSEFGTLFCGNDYKKDFILLKNYLAAFNVNVPTLFKQYGDLCETDGVAFFDFGVDVNFNDCIDGYCVVDRKRMKEAKRKRYIGE